MSRPPRTCWSSISSGRRRRLCQVEHAGIRRRRQHLQRGFRARPSIPGTPAALGGGLVGRRGGGAGHRHGLARAWLRHGRLAAQSGELLRRRRLAAFARPGGRSRRAAARSARLAVEGPMARNVEDVALLLDAMAGAEPARSVVAAGGRHQLPRCGARSGRLPRRVAVQPRSRHHAGRSGSRGDLSRRRRSGSQAPASSSRKRIPISREAHDCFQVLRALHLRDRAQARCSSTHRDKLKPEVVWNIEKGLKLIGRGYRRGGAAARSPCSSARLHFFETYDLLLAPATIVAALPGRAALCRANATATASTIMSNGWPSPMRSRWSAARPSRSRPASPARSCRSGCRSSRRRAAKPVLRGAKLLEDILDLGAITPIDPREPRR